METWQAVILGLVEGITEYLPVSSTGHLVIATALLGLDTPELKDAADSFDIVIQGGAILAVLGLYWPRVLQMLRGLLGQDPPGLRLFLNLVIAFIPSALLGLALNKWIKAHLFFAPPVMAALAVGGAYMILVERWAARRPRPQHEPDITDVTPKQALFIGLLQCASLIPGTSRSMMTITGGYFVGLAPGRAAEFSFLLGLPTLTAATLFSLYKNISESRAQDRPDLFHQLGLAPTLVGLVVAAISAAVAVRWLVGFLGRRGLAPFGWYRFALCAALLALWAAGIVRITPA
jgi:undecaprenyl-diphosphatase